VTDPTVGGLRRSLCQKRRTQVAPCDADPCRLIADGFCRKSSPAVGKRPQAGRWPLMALILIGVIALLPYPPALCTSTLTAPKSGDSLPHVHFIKDIGCHGHYGECSGAALERDAALGTEYLHTTLADGYLTLRIRVHSHAVDTGNGCRAATLGISISAFGSRLGPSPVRHLRSRSRSVPGRLQFGVDPP
jgi:hypothetical protein